MLPYTCMPCKPRYVYCIQGNVRRLRTRPCHATVATRLTTWDVAIIVIKARGADYVARRSTPWHCLRRSCSLKAREASGAVTVAVTIALAHGALFTGRTASGTFVHDGHCTCMHAQHADATCQHMHTAFACSLYHTIPYHISAIHVRNA